jgi:peptidoglycan/LPS O-acetylase OafA/YrhL
MLLTLCRYLALIYAIGLAIGEAVINSSKEHWQYAPLWIIDYIIVLYLLVGFWATRRGRYVPILMSAYALSAGVLYIAFFLHFDPELPESVRGGGVVLVLMGLILIVSVVGLAGTTAVWLQQERARASEK